VVDRIVVVVVAENPCLGGMSSYFDLLPREMTVDEEGAARRFLSLRWTNLPSATALIATSTTWCSECDM
jgi:hypothetical protein